MKFENSHLITPYEHIHPNTCHAEVGTPVKLYKIPKWLKTVARQHADEHDTAAFLAGNAERCGTTCWLDHWGTTNYKLRDGTDIEVFVSEPYDLGYDAIAHCSVLCKLLGIYWTVSACSFHYPTRTLRIALYPPEY